MMKRFTERGMPEHVHRDVEQAISAAVGGHEKFAEGRSGFAAAVTRKANTALMEGIRLEQRVREMAEASEIVESMRVPLARLRQISQSGDPALCKLMNQAEWASWNRFGLHPIRARKWPVLEVMNEFGKQLEEQIESKRDEYRSRLPVRTGNRNRAAVNVVEMIGAEYLSHFLLKPGFSRSSRGDPKRTPFERVCAALEDYFAALGRPMRISNAAIQEGIARAIHYLERRGDVRRTDERAIEIRHPPGWLPGRYD